MSLIHPLWQARRHVALALAVGLISACILLLNSVTLMTTSVLAFDLGALSYLMVIFILIRKTKESALVASMEHLKADNSGHKILLFALLASLMAIISIIGDLGLSASMQSWEKGAHIVLCLFTILLAWLFIHTMFALHYAKMYYKHLAKTGESIFLFPDSKPAPSYLDFIYFAYIIGTSAQTADISYAHREARKVGLMHGTLAFFFNVAVLSLLINIVSGLLPS